VKQAGADKAIVVIYKNDMMIMANDSGVTCCDVFYCVVSVILAIAFYGAIPLGILIGPPLFGIMGVYLIYVIWSCCHHSTRYINHLTPLEQMFKNI